MKRKISTHWQGDSISCFWTPDGVQRYHPGAGNDVEDLHRRYGGKCYYESRSGASGAGYLLPRPGDILIRLGFYRVDTGPGPGNQKREIVGTWENSQGWEDAPIWGYAPIVNGGAPEDDYYLPIVLTDGMRICFVSQHHHSGGPDAGHFARAIANWDCLPWNEAREIVVPFHNYSGRTEKNFLLLANGFRGVNALRFADLREAQDFARDQAEMCSSSRWSNVLDVGVQGGRVYVFDPLFGYVSDTFSYAPTQSWPGQINGWDVDTESPGKLFCYRQVSNFRVAAMAVNLETDEEFEREFLAAIFDPEEAQTELFRELRNKERRAAVIARMEEYSENIIRRTLEENPLMVVSLADSVAAGNCEYGTKRFLEQFGLEGKCTARELLEHPQFDSLLKNAAFRKVIAYVRHRPDIEASMAETI